MCSHRGLPDRGQVQGPCCLACLSCTDESGSLYKLERKTKRPFCYASLFSESKENLPIRCLHLSFQKQSSLNTDICLEPSVIYVASPCHETVKTTISFIFNSGKISVCLFKLTLLNISTSERGGPGKALPVGPQLHTALCYRQH